MIADTDQQSNSSYVESIAVHSNETGGNRIFNQIASFYIATLIVVGIVGNAISFILFTTSRHLKRVPSSQYLAALSLTDLTFVLCLSLIWLKSFGVNWQDLIAVCPASIYLSNTSCLLSGWYIMALTAEMAMAIVDPYRARRHCSRGLVAKRIIGIACFGCLINVWTLAIARSVPVPMENDEIDVGFIPPSRNMSSCDKGTNRTCDTDDRQPNQYDIDPIANGVVIRECGFNPEHKEYYNNLTILDSVVSFSLPLLVTLALNITIGLVLLRSFTKRQSLVEGNFCNNVVSTSTSALAVAVANAARRKKPCLAYSRTDSHELGTMNNSATESRRTALSPLLSSNSVEANSKKRNQRSRVTLVSSLLITKSLIYLLLNLPNYVHRLWQMTMSSDEEAPSESALLVQLIVYLLFYTQYSLNFVIYSMHTCKAACAPRSPVCSSVRRNVRVP